VSGERHASAALPPGKTRQPLCRRLGGPQVRSGRMRKISLPPCFDPRTVQPVASRCTDCAIQANNINNNNNKYVSICTDELLNSSFEFRSLHMLPAARRAASLTHIFRDRPSFPHTNAWTVIHILLPILRLHVTYNFKVAVA